MKTTDSMTGMVLITATAINSWTMHMRQIHMRMILSWICIVEIAQMRMSWPTELQSLLFCVQTLWWRGHNHGKKH
jgi:hypothetical protein